MRVSVECSMQTCFFFISLMHFINRQIMMCINCIWETTIQESRIKYRASSHRNKFSESTFVVLCLDNTSIAPDDSNKRLLFASIDSIGRERHFLVWTEFLTQFCCAPLFSHSLTLNGANYLIYVKFLIDDTLTNLSQHKETCEKWMQFSMIFFTHRDCISRFSHLHTHKWDKINGFFSML